MESTGRIFNIQRFSVYDGPGIRTTLFFKGCNLKCKWCHNPESIDRRQEIEFNPDKCISCRLCEAQCMNQAHEFSRVHEFHRDKCKQCFKCSETCYAKALVKVGADLSVEELFAQIKEDIPYFINSHGGVTLSGGECLLQHEFVFNLLKKLKQEGIHTAIDTAGHIPFWVFEKIQPYVDLFLYDIKARDAKIHKGLTGVENDLIIDNLKKLGTLKCAIKVRVPYIPTLNESEMEGIAQLLSTMNIQSVEVLPYHRLGEAKYRALGYEHVQYPIPIPDDKEMEKVRKVFRKYPIKIE